MAGQNNQHTLFKCETYVLQMPDADVEYHQNFLDADAGAALYQTLVEQTNWRQDAVKVYGKEHLTPRLTCWIGEPWMDYRYSNLTMHAQPWSETVLSVKQQIEDKTKESFNSVLLNYYRDGQDSNGWHSDDEPELGKQPIIASLSLGASRDFKLRHKHNKSLRHSISLEHGSLLIMRGDTQSHWQHHIPKRAKADGRINLTFRTIVKTRDNS